MTPLSGRPIELWVEARGGVAAVNPVMRALLDDLPAVGAAVSIRVPEHKVADPRRLLDGEPPDLVLLKTATTLGLSLAIADEAHGVKFLNGARETLKAHDKAAAMARLAAAGLPVPETFLFDPDPDGMSQPSGLEGAWVTKPTRGVHGRGVSVHPDPASALSTPANLDSRDSHIVDDGTRLLQRQIGRDSEADLKVYVAGGRCFAGSKAFTPVSYATDDIEPSALDRPTTEVVLSVGEALVLRLFGVDLRFEDGRLVIIDANPFPGYRGFPGAVVDLRFEIERALE